jgi:transcriptional regulator with XRE-family HTH domain
MSAVTDKMTTDNFAWVDWIISEREKRVWSQADLARKADIKRQTINGYEGRRRTNPDEKVLVKISQAFGYHPEHLPRMAGLLPPEPDKDPWIEKMNAKLLRVPPGMRDAADRMIESLATGEAEPNQNKATRKTKAAKP